MKIKLLETIKCLDGEAQNLLYHQRRVKYSLSTLGANNFHNLSELIKAPSEGLFRCRVIYDEFNTDIEYIKYIPRAIKSIKIVHENNINYSLKYSNRDAINTLFSKRLECDDILIVKNSLIADTTIANIALFNGDRWVTPKKPLLYGTTRARLLDEGMIVEDDINIDELYKYTKVAIMNAMIGFKEVGLIEEALRT
ncbi:MAG: branched-chain amino acid aminotransferase [Helicobacteraceae bacterium]|nr:branched-chain amino acid aminotransferase [Helicobacteraceae bacterium]